MDLDEAISVASKWVKDRYPVVPSVARAFQITDDMFSEDELTLNPDFREEDAKAVADKWFVGYFCDWDTDALGMPEYLIVLVDNNTQEVELAPDF